MKTIARKAPSRRDARVRPAFYKPASRWHFFAALAGAILLEAAAVAVASLHAPVSIPTDPGITQDEFSAEGVFITEVQPEPTPPPEETPPAIPPDPVDPADFVIEQPIPPPHPQNPSKSQPKVAALVAKGTQVGPIDLGSTKGNLTSAPRPSYPYEARRAKQTGSGKFLLTFDAAGSVTQVTLIQSTGSQILDQVSMSTFRRWRCRPGVYKQAYVPITFTLTGARL